MESAKNTGDAPSVRLTPEQIRAAARLRVQSAMRHIENAQNELAAACADLSAITGGVPIWNACHKMTDKVHAFWYRVQTFSFGTRYSLDSANVEGLQRRLAASKAGGQAVAP